MRARGPRALIAFHEGSLHEVRLIREQSIAQLTVRIAVSFTSIVQLLSEFWLAFHVTLKTLTLSPRFPGW